MCGPGRSCTTSGPGVRRPYGTMTDAAARRSDSTPTATTTTGCKTSWFPLRWPVAAADSLRPTIRDGQLFFPRAGVGRLRGGVGEGRLRGLQQIGLVILDGE